MRHGNFAAAWDISDRVLRQRRASRIQCHTWPRHLQFIWNGDCVEDKRVLVRCYHGLGDTLQFVRLLAPLRERARHVALWVQPALIELLADVQGVDALLSLHDGTPDVEYDIDVESMELAHLLRVTPEDLPNSVPYLRVKSALDTRRSENVRVGVAWRSGDWDESRSIPDASLYALQEIPRVEWFSLQYDHRPPSFMVDLACKDIHEQAVRMCGLDLIISVDTMIAHLAGALALPTWTLLPSSCDWRWMVEREDSAWYPTMRLFRQRRERDWSEVLQRVGAELRRTFCPLPNPPP